MASNVLTSKSPSAQVPYPHCYFQSALSASHFAHISDWLNTKALWRRKVTTFYDQFNCINIDDMLNGAMRTAVGSAVKAMAEASLGVDLHDYCELTAHRMVKGQQIGVHNDDPNNDSEFEDFRFLLFVNQSRRHPVPGILLLDRRIPDKDIRAVNYDFVPNAAVGMQLGPSSYHAVLEIEDGYRDTLLLSYWSKSRKLPERAADPEEKRARSRRNNSPLFYQVVDEIFPSLDGVRHSDGHLASHLVGTAEILRVAGADEATSLAGLVHSVNGTSRFKLDYSEQRQRSLASICDSAGELGARVMLALESFKEVVELKRKGKSNNQSGDPRLLSGYLIEIANDVEQQTRSKRRVGEILPLLTEIAAVNAFGDYRFAITFPELARTVAGVSRKLAKKLWPDLVIVELPDAHLAMYTARLGTAAEEIGDKWFEESGLSPETTTSAVGVPLRKSAFDFYLLHHSQLLPVWASKGILERSARLLHCDSHDDLGKIPVRIVDNEVRCSVTGRSYGALSSPNLDEMIRYGTITIGNFLTMALLMGEFSDCWFVSHELEGMARTTLHIGESEFVEQGRQFACIRAERNPANIRHAIKTTDYVCAGQRFLEQAFDEAREIVFDLDADYFCNRFDNSKECFCRGECDRSAVSHDIFTTLSVLQRERHKVISATCALSPGFFNEAYLRDLGASSLQWA